eukprot:70178-Chlamydomonas_euryale.AAC.2
MQPPTLVHASMLRTHALQRRQRSHASPPPRRPAGPAAYEPCRHVRARMCESACAGGALCSTTEQHHVAQCGWPKHLVRAGPSR